MMLVRMVRWLGDLGLPLLMLAGLAMPNRAAAQPDVDIFVGSTADGTGELAARYDFSVPVPVFQNVCAGGRCLLASTNPGVNVLAERDPDSGLFPLAAASTLRLEILAIDSRLSVKVGDTVLRSAGQSAVLGATPDVHIHPSWQANVAQGEVGTWSVEFRITTSSPRYGASPGYTLLLTNVSAEPTASPTPTHSPGLASPSSTPMSTPTPTGSAEPPCPGDCDANREVTVDELVRGVAIALGTRSVDACAVLDANRDGDVTVDELIVAVNSALRGCADD